MGIQAKDVAEFLSNPWDIPEFLDNTRSAIGSNTKTLLALCFPLAAVIARHKPAALGVR
jgi:hypothetical protein